jgi:co-chaperonin GroES (HSP10)
MDDSFTLEDRAATLGVLHNRVLVEWQEFKEEFRGLPGIIRPDTHREANYTGLVLRCGPDCTDEAKEMTGKRVLFDRWSETFREHNWKETNGKRYALINDWEMLAQLEEEAVNAQP